MEEFKAEIKSLKEELEKKRELQKIPVTLPNGKSLDLSFGEHNTLQKAIIEVFSLYLDLEQKCYTSVTRIISSCILKKKIERIEFLHFGARGTS